MLAIVLVVVEGLVRLLYEMGVDSSTLPWKAQSEAKEHRERGCEFGRSPWWNTNGLQ